MHRSIASIASKGSFEEKSERKEANGRGLGTYYLSACRECDAENKAAEQYDVKGCYADKDLSARQTGPVCRTGSATL
jgi:hypothetical protein